MNHPFWRVNSMNAKRLHPFSLNERNSKYFFKANYHHDQIKTPLLKWKQHKLHLQVTSLSYVLINKFDVLFECTRLLETTRHILPFIHPSFHPLKGWFTLQGGLFTLIFEGWIKLLKGEWRFVKYSLANKFINVTLIKIRTYYRKKNIISAYIYAHASVKKETILNVHPQIETSQ